MCWLGWLWGRLNWQAGAFLYVTDNQTQNTMVQRIDVSV